APAGRTARLSAALGVLVRAPQRLLQLSNRPERGEYHQRQARERDREERDEHGATSQRGCPRRREDDLAQSDGDERPQQRAAQIRRGDFRKPHVHPQSDRARSEEKENREDPDTHTYS